MTKSYDLIMVKAHQKGLKLLITHLSRLSTVNNLGDSYALVFEKPLEKHVKNSQLLLCIESYVGSKLSTFIK